MAAVAWFTDREISLTLCAGKSVGHKGVCGAYWRRNYEGPGGLNFHRLGNFGGQVILLAGSRDEPTMHHKFCVIDGATVITGSYNWSHKARSNDENITVVSDTR